MGSCWEYWWGCCGDGGDDAVQSVECQGPCTLLMLAQVPGSSCLFKSGAARDFSLLQCLYSQRFLFCCAPKQWNSLLSDICHIQSSPAFKTHLNRQYYNKRFQIMFFSFCHPSPLLLITFFLCTCLCVCVYVYMCVCVCVIECVRVCVCVHAHVCGVRGI